MGDSATSGTDTAGSLDSQQSIEYSLNNVTKTPSEANRTQVHENSPTDKDQVELMDIGQKADLRNQRQTEQEQSICTDSNEKDRNVEDGNGQMDNVSSSDSPLKQVNKTEDSDQTDKLKESDSAHHTNEERNKDCLESVDKEKTATCGQVNEEVNCEPPSEHNKPVVQESQYESMELGEDKGVKQTSMKVNRDEDSGQTSSAIKECTSRLVQEENSSSDSSDDGYWGRPWASRDTQMYRLGYPGKSDNPVLNLNYEFYMNQRCSEPDGDYIDTIHEKWRGNYRLLELHHGYIQWLFPIRESGMNWFAQELQPHEIKKICADTKAHKRILTSYEMMLDFYGMKLKNAETGELERAENWFDRFCHLNHSMHNYLRITRILKCLGEFEYEHLKAPFVQFVLYEAIVEQTLKNTKKSCLNYWLEVIKDDGERKKIRRYAKQLSGHVNHHQKRS